jgi:hypothetical protein
VVDDDGQVFVFVFEMLIEQVAELRLGPDQMDSHGESAAGKDGSPDLRLGSLIGTNGVKRDVGKHRGCDLLLFLHIEHGAALVLAALGAGLMGQLFFVAIGALRESGSGKKVVRTAKGGAARGMAPFRIRHDAIPFKSGPAAWLAGS